MLITPKPIGKMELSPEELSRDKKECLKCGPCGAGKKALYLGSFYISRRFYVPYPEIRRVFKRVAMSAGGFTGKGAFGTMPYLVVVLRNGTEKQSNFKREEDVDKILDWIRKHHPEIPTVTKKAEEEAARSKAAPKKEIADPVRKEIAGLSSDIRYLEERPEISNNLSITCRRKRIVDQIPAGTILLVSAIAVIGVLVIVGAVYAFAQKVAMAPYILLIGAAFLFFAIASNILPIGQNSKKAAKKGWEKALSDARAYVKEKRDFFLPAQYAHPIVLKRMIRILESGRAKTKKEAYELLKSDLKALNSSVKVSQEEHDEVVIVKPLFLECEYKDSLG